MALLKKVDQTNFVSLYESQKEEWAKLDYEFFKNFESELTQRSYRRDIQQFFEFLSEHFPTIKNFKSVERVHVVAYKNFLTELDLAPKSICRKLSSTSSYFQFLTEKDITKFNPFDSVKRPKQMVMTATNDLSDQQISDLFSYIDNEDVKKNTSCLLHKAIIYLFFTTGIRKAELINLKLKDIKEFQGEKVIEIRAKGGKYLLKLLHPKTFGVIQEYLEWMESAGRKVEMNDWVFQPTKNPLDGNLIKPLNPRAIDYIIKTYCQKIGVTHNVSPHSARASYIGSALENGADLLKVSQDVGHASVRTTQEYNKRRNKVKDSPVFNLGFLKTKD